MNYNYPPTQEWFDEGFAQYFSSLRLGDNQAQVGADPTLDLPWSHALPAIRRRRQPSQVLYGITGPPVAAHAGVVHHAPGPSGYPPMFYAQSWIVMHYLINQNKLSDAGAYFGLVQLRKVPVEQAIRQAFGMSAEQFEQAVKDYFQSFPPSSPAQPRPGSDRSTGASSTQFLAPLRPLDVGSSVQDVLDGQAQALVAEMAVRYPNIKTKVRKTSKAS